MELIDTHCHLFASEFNADRDAMIARAKEAGVSKFLLPNIDAKTISSLKEVVSSYSGECYPMMGLHPTSVKEDFKTQLETIQKELESGSYIAIGEIGLDYYWDTTFKMEQIEAFTRQLEWAIELSLPVAIHTRNSFEDAIQIVAKLQDGRLKGVFHCFSGSQDDAMKIIDAGFMLGIGGVLTFKNGGIDKILPEINMQHLILETDSPYLAPVPYRGKRNESAYILEVAKKLAEIKGVSVEQVAEVTSGNAERLFRID